MYAEEKLMSDSLQTRTPSMGGSRSGNRLTPQQFECPRVFNRSKRLIDVIHDTYGGTRGGCKSPSSTNAVAAQRLMLL